MTVVWSLYAKEQRAAILRTIAQELSREDASRWNGKFREAVSRLVDFPELGGYIPARCFAEVPDQSERLRQMQCNPYRIIYEVVDDQIRILSIKHGRMLVTLNDARWHD